MALLVVRDVTHRFAGPPVLDGASLRLDKGDRVCIFGRNGEGKSTLLKLVAGVYTPDSGGIDVQKGAKVGTLAQEVPEGRSGTVHDVVTSGLGDVSARLRSYHDAVAAVSADPSDANLSALDAAQRAVDAADAWKAQERVETVLSRLGLDGDAAFETLSGGWRRRAFLAAALVQEPDVLLLDEPTNHLDVEAIEWLESELQRFAGAVVFVTHDRAFLRAVATRIVELDRGKLREYPADFDAYVEAKSADLTVEETHNAHFDKKLAAEEAWIRTGIKARRTRNEGRVRALKRLREERKQRRNRKGTARFALQSAERSGDDVIQAEGITFRYDDRTIVDGFDLNVRRGDRIGFIGPNGVGKTTLLRLLLGDLEPQAGAVSLGTKLSVAYSDQMRAQLDPSKTLAKTVCPDGDHVILGDRQKHVISYLKDFLFDESQVRGPVSVLSGGERNRLVLAKLMTMPANVLVLDEPTNDLDMETLEVLETQLLEFEGTVLLVSHDREFLDNVVTESLIFRGEGEIIRLIGGYSEWAELRREQLEAEAQAAKAARDARTPSAPAAPKKAPSPLSKKEKTELAELPKRIEQLEARQGEIHATLSDPTVFRDDPSRASTLTDELARVESTLAAAYERWEALELLAES